MVQRYLWVNCRHNTMIPILGIFTVLKFLQINLTVMWILFPFIHSISALIVNTIQDLRTTFNPQTGNMTSRVNTGASSNTEYFYYDVLGRLNYDYYGPSSYDIKGNAIYRSGVGTMTYTGTAHPYQIEQLNASGVSVTRPSPQTVTYTAYDRPVTITEGYPVSSITYNATYQRVKMQTAAMGSVLQKKYYIGDRYEREENSSGTVTAQRLFLGGDAYSAPMVLQKTGSGSWTPYVIGRDYLGSITNIVTTSGTSVATYSYDAWGRMRDPETLTPYASTSQPSLLLGRGYCGHEHLSGYGLINMNARLYDPVLGRFLSPDPYVQSPDFSQNFNRYAYALNNPLKYTDESGEFIGIDSFIINYILSGFDEDMAIQALHNDIRIWGGLFNVDKNKGVLGGAWELISRFTWQYTQNVYGFIVAQAINTFRLGDGVTSVEYLHGATVVSAATDRWSAITLGSFISGGKYLDADNGNDLFQHEFGHYLQSQDLGPLYLMKVGFPSAIDKGDHANNPVEQDANIRAFNYFKQYYSSDFDSFDSTTGKYMGLWHHERDSAHPYGHPIVNMNWNNYGNSTSVNELALSKTNIVFYWHDYVSLWNPATYLLGGIINIIINNSSFASEK